ncbi:MAG: DUF819 family protein [Gammaproteobacteria bacterium]|nr:DUF819 family protein [Gammaproteobacteria bacterium]MBT8150483.1 DUF819 family protein [Gammaproteobacteria bacterium]NNM11390.1 DUF819 family protein [Pseudomonadales bacterium]
MMQQLVFVLVALLVPAGILWLAGQQAWANKLGVIVLCYTMGLLAGNMGLIPPNLLSIQSRVSDLSIALAMPLLLFTLDVRLWRSVAGKALLSMVLATTSVVSLASCLFFIIREPGDAAASHYAAMSVGVYTGGTPNLAAIKAGLNIPHSEYIVFHSLDTLIGSAYILLMLTLGVSFFRAVLPASNSVPNAAQDINAAAERFESDDYSSLLRRQNLPQLCKPIALAIVVVALAWAVSQGYTHFFATGASAAVMIVALTTLGIGLSLLPGVRRLMFSYKLGMYLIYVFCFVVASMASFEKLAAVDIDVAIFLFGTVAGSLFLHGLLCRIFGIDSDTFMVTSVAAVCSPPFVPMMARALGNPTTILSGMTTGIIGYALGNYLGISLGLFLQSL